MKPDNYTTEDICTYATSETTFFCFTPVVKFNSIWFPDLKKEFIRENNVLSLRITWKSNPAIVKTKIEKQNRSKKRLRFLLFFFFFSSKSKKLLRRGKIAFCACKKKKKKRKKKNSLQRRDHRWKNLETFLPSRKKKEEKNNSFDLQFICWLSGKRSKIEV